MKQPRKVLLATPKYFDVVDVKNVYMRRNLKLVDKEKAMQQWSNLHNVYQTLKTRGIIENVLSIKGVKGCEDMVFAANQSFPWMLKDERVVVMGKMKHPSRQKEIPAFRKFYKTQGYKILELQSAEYFEGMGDTIPHPGKNLLWGGYGHRSELTAYDELKDLLKTEVITLKLISEKFYHLDTCFLPVNAKTVLICKQAFDEEGLKKIQSGFDNAIEIPLEEAEKYFALNAHCIAGEEKIPSVAIIQKGAAKTIEILKQNNYEVMEIDTSEFMKSGGSVFCMKMMIF